MGDDATKVAELPFDDDAFVKLLGKLVGEARHLQNNPPDLVPVEDRGAGGRPGPTPKGHSTCRRPVTRSQGVTTLAIVAVCRTLGPGASSDLTGSRACGCLLAIHAAGRHVLEALEPYAVENGGPLRVKHVSYVEGRGNIIVEYPGE